MLPQDGLRPLTYSPVRKAEALNERTREKPNHTRNALVGVFEWMTTFNHWCITRTDSAAGRPVSPRANCLPNAPPVRRRPAGDDIVLCRHVLVLRADESS